MNTTDRKEVVLLDKFTRQIYLFFFAFSCKSFKNDERSTVCLQQPDLLILMKFSRN